MHRIPIRPILYLTAALLVAGGGVGVAVAATAPSGAGTLTATFAKDSDWGSGYQGTFTIRNRGGKAATGWRVEFSLPAGSVITSAWDANVTGTAGRISATNRGYNATIAAGGSTSFGLVVKGSGSPTGCTVNGAPCTGNGPPATATVPAAPASPTATASAPAPGAGTPSATAPKPTSTSKPGPGRLPVAPYVDMGVLSNGGSLQQLAADSGIGSFTLAFVTSAGCRASWFNAFDPRQRPFADQVAALRARGGDVKISFGGATGIELAQACTDVNALQAEYQAVVSAYDLKFIDLDIEGAAVADAASVQRRSTALAALQRRNPGLKVSLTLPVLPEGLTQDGLNVVRSAKAAGVDLDLVNIMAMDYGRAAQDYGELAKQAATSTARQLQGVLGIGAAESMRRLGVTPMLGQNDDQGKFAQSDATDLVTFATANGIGYLSFWEATRDRNTCTGALFQCTNVPQQKFEFSRIFARFRG
jgi:hypothetical protein